MIISVITAFVAIGVFLLQRLIYKKFAFSRVTYRCFYSADEVREGDIFYITEEIVNRKWLALPLVCSLLEIGDGMRFIGEGDEIFDKPSAFGFTAMGGYKKLTKTWRLVAVHRGRFDIKSVTVSIRDPLGFRTHAADFAVSAEILILPAAIEVARPIPLLETARGNAPIRHGYFTDPLVTQKIVPYTYSEPQNRINWSASAKTGALMVSVEHPVRTDDVIVALNMFSSSDDNVEHISSPEHTERSVKVAASLINLLKPDAALRLLSNGTTTAASALKTAAEDYLETVEFDLSRDFLAYSRLLAELNFSDKHSIAVLIRRHVEIGTVNADKYLLIITPYIDDGLLELYDFLTRRGIRTVFLKTARGGEPEDLAVYYL